MGFFYVRWLLEFLSPYNKASNKTPSDDLPLIRPKYSDCGKYVFNKDTGESRVSYVWLWKQIGEINVN